MTPHFIVASVAKRFDRRHISGAAKEAEFEDIEAGWLVTLRGSHFSFVLDAPHATPVSLKEGDVLVMMKLKPGEPETPEPILPVTPIASCGGNYTAVPKVPVPDRSEQVTF